MSFIFGGNTGLSYDQAQQKRAIAQQLMRRRTSAPKNVGEGLSAIGEALMYRGLSKQADKADNAGRAEADSLFGNFAPNKGAGPMPGGDTIRAGLIKRGLPEHIADGFVMNFKDESGFNPGINERNPIVEGSRGGFGLAQWTGPRRVALEEFAQTQGRPVDDMDLQLDFLMQELQGSEANAAKSIFSTKDSGSAAAAIVNDFLRPAEEHRARRSAQYTGGNGATTEQLMAAMAHPYMRPEQKSVLSMLLQQKMQANDPVRQLQMEKTQLELEKMRNPQPRSTDDMAEYLFAQSQGYEGTFTQFMQDLKRAGSTNVSTTVNTGNSPDQRPVVDKPEKAFQRRWDPENQTWVDEPIPGGSVAREERQVAEAKSSSAATATSIITGAARKARDAAGDRNFGAAGTSIIGKLPWTDSAEVMRQVAVLKAQATIENLNQMRAQSPTGGALGNVTEKEGAMLSDKSGALDPNSPTFLRDLEDYERTLLRVVHGQQAGDEMYRASRPVPTQESGPPSFLSEQDRDLWEYFTEEERKAVLGSYQQ